jgi:FkbM family methyltransferase
MSRAVSPHLHHRIMRQIGIGFFGIKGVDWLLRRAHSPDRRQQWYLRTKAQALWGGPKFHLETRWFTEWQTYFYGTQDRGIHHWVKSNASEHWICFDVGTNFGFFACLCAQLCREVHGFEPVPTLLERAEHNRVLNGLRNLLMNQTALSNRKGKVSFHLPSSESTNWGTGSLIHGQQGEVVDVETTTLDCYCREREVNRLDFMKIDVEGAEHLVLQGGVEVLCRLRPIIIFENNADSRDSAFLLLRDCGYSLHELSGNPVDREFVDGNQPSDFLALPKPL